VYEACQLKGKDLGADTIVHLGWCRSLQAAQQELTRQKTIDSLKKNLEKRPDRETLVERMCYPAMLLNLISFHFCWLLSLLSLLREGEALVANYKR
jgi:hypothetical protein